MNVTELSSYLGLLKYVLHEVFAGPTYADMSTEHAVSFGSEAVMEREEVDLQRGHYASKMPMKLARDASSCGLGVVISHVFPDGTEKPVPFVSVTMTTAEQNY